MTAVYTWDVFSTLDGYGSYLDCSIHARLQVRDVDSRSV